MKHIKPSSNTPSSMNTNDNESNFISTYKYRLRKLNHDKQKGKFEK